MGVTHDGKRRHRSLADLGETAGFRRFLLRAERHRGRGREIGVPRAVHVAFKMLPGAAPQFWSVPEAGPGWERAGWQSNNIMRHN